MEYSIAHQKDPSLDPEHDVFPWNDPVAPNWDGKSGDRTAGSLRRCPYCGSMHPADVAAAIRAGAKGEWADQKYGWPHKAYFTDVPNPHAGMLESRASANFQHKPDWIKVGEREWREPGEPAPKTTDGKFYTVHLQDATPEDRANIEAHLGLTFTFHDNGKVEWHPVTHERGELK
jgi:hypothetical protein